MDKTDQFFPACSICGYSLRGLSEAGKCPECGGDYGPDILVLWGEQSPRRKGRKEFELALVVVFGVAAVFIVAIMHSFLAFGALAVVLVFLILRLRNRWRGWQVRISREGYGIRSGIGPINMQPWDKADEIGFRKIPGKNYLLAIRTNLVKRLALEFPCDEIAAESLQARLQLLSVRQITIEK